MLNSLKKLLSIISTFHNCCLIANVTEWDRGTQVISQPYGTACNGAFPIRKKTPNWEDVFVAFSIKTQPSVVLRFRFTYCRLKVFFTSSFWGKTRVKPSKILCLKIKLHLKFAKYENLKKNKKKIQRHMKAWFFERNYV